MKKYQFYSLIGVFCLCLVVGVVRSFGRSGPFGVGAKSKSICVLEIFSPLFYGPSDDGSIFSGSQPHVGTWIKQIDAARKDKNVVGLLIRINSPGGSVAATQELYQSLVRFKEAKKKILISVVDICASGAYYISAPADEIMVNPGSLVGSIGVIMASMEYSDLMRKLGIRFNTIKSGTYKDILSPSRRMAASEKKELQALVDEMHQQFVDTIIHWRGKISSPKVIKRRANGMIYSSTMAQQYGLVDSIGDFEAAKQALARHCEIELKYLQIIFLKSKVRFDFFNLLRGFVLSPLKTFLQKEAASQTSPSFEYR